jgi:hypothetical protein
VSCPLLTGKVTDATNTDAMASVENRSEPQPNIDPRTKDHGMAIVVTPTGEGAVRLKKTPDGGMTINFSGEIAIGIAPPLVEATR